MPVADWLARGAGVGEPEGRPEEDPERVVAALRGIELYQLPGESRRGVEVALHAEREDLDVEGLRARRTWRRLARRAEELGRVAVAAEGEGDEAAAVERGWGRRRRASELRDDLGFEGVAPEDPERERVPERPGEHLVEVAEPSRGPLARRVVHQDAVDRLLQAERRKRRGAELQGPLTLDEGALRELPARRRDVHEPAVERHPQRVGGEEALVRDAQWEVVDERRRVADEAAQGLGPGEEGRAEELRRLEAQLRELRRRGAVAPEAEDGVGVAAGGAARAHQDPIQARAGPERALVEDVAERSDDCLGVRLAQVVHGEPVGRQAALVQAIPDELEVLAAVEVHDPRQLRRRRFSGDEVVAVGRGGEEERAILDVDP